VTQVPFPSRSWKTERYAVDAGTQSFFVVVRPVPPDTNQRNVTASLFIYATDGRREISAELLRELYGLTRAQAELMHLLTQGPRSL
jgi:hypothetical protein